MNQCFTEPPSIPSENTTTVFKRVTNLPEFDRDMKKLRKRFPTLPDALDVFINTPLKLFHRMELNTADIRRIAGLGIEEPKIYKARKIPCRDLKGRGSRTGLRICMHTLHQRTE